MADGFNKPAMTVAGIAGLCVSVAMGLGLGAYTVTGIDPLSAHGTSLAEVPYAGAERDNAAVAGPDRAAVADYQPKRSDWVGEDSGRADSTEF
jgi:hypothetical protein